MSITNPTPPSFFLALVVMTALLAACGQPTTSKAARAPGPTAVRTPAPYTREAIEAARQAVLNYEMCAGAKLSGATAATLQLAGSQTVSGSSATYDARQELHIVSVGYKAANGAEKEVKFNYRAGRRQAVMAENDDGLAVLRTMGAYCAGAR